MILQQYLAKLTSKLNKKKNRFFATLIMARRWKWTLRKFGPSHDLRQTNFIRYSLTIFNLCRNAQMEKQAKEIVWSKFSESLFKIKLRKLNRRVKYM